MMENAPCTWVLSFAASKTTKSTANEMVMSQVPESSSVLRPLESTR